MREPWAAVVAVTFITRVLFIVVCHVLQSCIVRHRPSRLCANNFGRDCLDRIRVVAFVLGDVKSISQNARSLPALNDGIIITLQHLLEDLRCMGCSLVHDDVVRLEVHRSISSLELLSTGYPYGPADVFHKRSPISVLFCFFLRCWVHQN